MAPLTTRPWALDRCGALCLYLKLPTDMPPHPPPSHVCGVLLLLCAALVRIVCPALLLTHPSRPTVNSTALTLVTTHPPTDRHMATIMTHHSNRTDRHTTYSTMHSLTTRTTSHVAFHTIMEPHRMAHPIINILPHLTSHLTHLIRITTRITRLTTLLTRLTTAPRQHPTIIIISLAGHHSTTLLPPTTRPTHKLCTCTITTTASAVLQSRAVVQHQKKAVCARTNAVETQSSRNTLGVCFLHFFRGCMIVSWGCSQSHFVLPLPVMSTKMLGQVYVTHRVPRCPHPRSNSVEENNIPQMKHRQARSQPKRGGTADGQTDRRNKHVEGW